MATDLIKDCIERIQLAMREGRFSKDELEFLAKWFEKAAEITRKTLAKQTPTTID